MTECEEIRASIRAGRFTGPTSGLCKGFLQANIVILPRSYFEDFLDFCLKNPRPCPLVGVGDSGDPRLLDLGKDIDIRTDLPRYVVYENGVNVGEPTDIMDLWQDDLVTFALGCSFTFENALALAGIPMRHIDANTTVPMFRTNISAVPNAVFGSDLVVSMRPIPRGQIDTVNRICDRYPFAHGRPVHIGDPSGIGIADIASPDRGDRLLARDGEVYAFWACGVTTQLAIEAARIPFAITHKPGAMLITAIPGTEAGMITDTSG